MITDGGWNRRPIPVTQGTSRRKSLVGRRVREVLPGPGVQTDEDYINYAVANAKTDHHPAGTCRMGSDAAAVVDTRLRLNGIEGLRVVDASIMPRLISSNTNAPTIMIAEKAADMIRADHGA